MRDRPHSHPCQHCLTTVECHGTLSFNYDGFPETWCDDYHKLTGVFLCESCDRLFKDAPECHVCGDPAVHVVEDSDDASGYRGEIGLCAQHWAERR
jgi:hypothetical protein